MEMKLYEWVRNEITWQGRESLGGYGRWDNISETGWSRDKPKKSQFCPLHIAHSTNIGNRTRNFAIQLSCRHDIQYLFLIWNWDKIDFTKEIRIYDASHVVETVVNAFCIMRENGKHGVGLCYSAFPLLLRLCVLF